MSKKEQWPLRIVAKGANCHKVIKAVDEEGNAIIKRDISGNPLWSKGLNGRLEHTCETEVISWHPFDKRDNNTNYSMLVLNKPKNKREQYIIDEVLKDLAEGKYYTHEQYEEIKNPTLKTVRKYMEEKEVLQDEKSELEKQLAAQRAKLSAFEGKNK
jgi:hypothetical protein